MPAMTSTRPLATPRFSATDAPNSSDASSSAMPFGVSSSATNPPPPKRATVRRKGRWRSQNAKRRRTGVSVAAVENGSSSPDRHVLEAEDADGDRRQADAVGD